MRLTFERLWIVLALALPTLLSLLVALPAVDLAYQVRAGELILSSGAIPTVDTWTFTAAGTVWADQQWLAQVLLALGYRVGGWEFLAVLRAGLVLATTGLLLGLGVARGSSVRTSAILALIAFLLAAPALALRPQLFAIAVFAALLVLVAVRERHPRLYLAAPLLVILWANLHGSFVLAPVLLGYAWVDNLARRRPARRALAVLVVGTVATLVNPLGLGVWAYAAGIGGNAVITGRATEWQRTAPFTVPGTLFYASVLGAVVLAVRCRARLSGADWLWLGAMAALGAAAVRGLAWWPAGAVLVVAAAAPFAASLGTDTRVRRGSALNTVVACLLMVVLVLAAPWWRPADLVTGRRALLAYAPAGLATALRGIAPAGSRVYVPQTWGSWFEWAVPGATYFVDARFELFDAAVWSDLDAIVAGGASAAQALNERHVDIVVLAAGDSGPGSAWTQVYADPDGQILIRSPLPTVARARVAAPERDSWGAFGPPR